VAFIEDNNISGHKKVAIIWRFQIYGGLGKQKVWRLRGDLTSYSLPISIKSSIPFHQLYKELLKMHEG
jgi:hypothetical protein